MLFLYQSEFREAWLQDDGNQKRVPHLKSANKVVSSGRNPLRL